MSKKLLNFKTYIMKLTKTILIISFFFFFTSSFSQEKTFKIEDSGITPSYKGHNDGNITITQDAKLLQIVKKHKDLNRDRFRGWRVQIYFDSGQRAMRGSQNAKGKFLGIYSGKYRAYSTYDSPYYKILVGDFRTRAEAMHFKEEIKDKFPNSWVNGNVRINYPIEK